MSSTKTTAHASICSAARESPRAAAPRSFTTVVQLETTAEDSAIVSMGDLDGDGRPDITLARSGATNVLFLSTK